jgi:hypothetical protein
LPTIHPYWRKSVVTRRPRIQAYIEYDVYRRAENQAKRLGKTMSEHVSDALVAYSPDMTEWSAKQAGYQTMMILSLTLAMAKRTMSESDIRQAREVAGQAAEIVFGRLGERPFHPRSEIPEDNRMAALFEAFRFD